MNKIHSVEDIFEKKSKFVSVTKTPELIAKCKEHNCLNDLDEVSLGQDDDGFYVYTHRARSDSYKKPESISIKDIKFISSTG